MRVRWQLLRHPRLRESETLSLGSGAPEASSYAHCYQTALNFGDGAQNPFFALQAWQSNVACRGTRGDLFR